MCVVVPLLPVMVMVRVPLVARLLAVMVMVEDPAPVIELGLKERVVPLPCPDAVREIAELKPPVTAEVMETVPELLLATVIAVGAALSEKFGLVPVTVSAIEVVETVLPEVPVMVMG